jgi:ABC-type multidrug transport system ATPase subunit
MTDALLTVDSVARQFSDLSVLADATFQVEPGTVACLVGPNGSGKTTLLRIVAGLLVPSGGRVRIDAAATRTVGYLPQRPSFRAGFSVAETLDFYAALAGVDVDPDAALARVGLADVADRRVEALSGGMTRLFGIAQAAVGDPPLLVLDEPSSGLDPTMTKRVGDVVTDLAADATVLLATHDLATAERVADTVLVLDRGTIAAAASPSDLLATTDTDSLTDAVNAYIEDSEAGLTVRSGRQGEQS